VCRNSAFWLRAWLNARWVFRAPQVGSKQGKQGNGVLPEGCIPRTPLHPHAPLDLAVELAQRDGAVMELPLRPDEIVIENRALKLRVGNDRGAGSDPLAMDLLGRDEPLQQHIVPVEMLNIGALPGGIEAVIEREIGELPRCDEDEI